MNSETAANANTLHNTKTSNAKTTSNTKSVPNRNAANAKISPNGDNANNDDGLDINQTEQVKHKTRYSYKKSSETNIEKSLSYKISPDMNKKKSAVSASTTKGEATKITETQQQ